MNPILGGIIKTLAFMKEHLTAVLFIAAIVLFFVGRMTAPAPAISEDKEHIEQLKREKANAWAIAEQAIDSMNAHIAREKEHEARFHSHQVVETKNKTDYEAEIRRIKSFTPTQLDSELVKEFGRLYTPGDARVP